jgi:hypothetical protein
LTENQVLELLQAFGKVKAFHLVKNEPDSLTSKGYCFVEYADPNVTPVAVIGLNGMDLGGGKVLTARVAGERSAVSVIGVLPTSANAMGVTLTQMSGFDAVSSGPKPGSVIVGGYEIDVLVDAALGLRPMPTAPMHLDQFGMPITRDAILPVAPLVVPQDPDAVRPLVATSGMVAAIALPPGSSALDIANAALDAAFGSSGIPAPPQHATRILVLLNMVTDEDLQTDEDYNGLKEEVEEEVSKYGKLISIQIPRRAIGTIEQSAVRKIFLEYTTVEDAANAEKELSGRQFGSNVVQASFFDEHEYSAGKLK